MISRQVIFESEEGQTMPCNYPRACVQILQPLPSVGVARGPNHRKLDKRDASPDYGLNKLGMHDISD